MPNTFMAFLQAYIHCLEHFISADIQNLNPFHNLQQITLCLPCNSRAILPVTYMHNLTLNNMKYHLPFLCPQNSAGSVEMALMK